MPEEQRGNRFDFFAICSGEVLESIQQILALGNLKVNSRIDQIHKRTLAQPSSATLKVERKLESVASMHTDDGIWSRRILKARKGFAAKKLLV
jgi:hypothetical protein